MAGLLELGEIMMTASERRLEIVARNISNISTAGYKKSEPFDDVAAGIGLATAQPSTNAVTNFAQGPLQQTRRPLDLAISGAGWFKIASGDHVYYTRAGQFSRDAEGRVVNAQGFALQTSDGGDLVLSGDAPDILGDGAVLENGVPIAHVGVFQPSGDAQMTPINGSLFSAPNNSMQDVEAPTLRQGMIESANVESSAEMLQMMSSLRQAEAGARVVQAYDSLIGQSITTFGRVSK